jgi:large subunit ribosomal protein L16
LQYGIVAIHGGYMEPRHFEMLRQKFSKYLVEGKSFAIYRVDAPFKPWTRKGTGKALGGGKGSIDHYRLLFITSLWLFCQFTSISN